LGPIFAELSNGKESRMTDIQIGNLWGKHFLGRFNEPVSRQICELIVRLIHVKSDGDSSVISRSMRITLVLATLGIVEEEFEAVEKESSKYF
jgi:hypothetical protein